MAPPSEARVRCGTLSAELLALIQPRGQSPSLRFRVCVCSGNHTGTFCELRPGEIGDEEAGGVPSLSQFR